jgi:hypothetical protein
MGFETVHFIRRAELVADAPSGCTLTVSTDQPGGVIASRGAHTKSATTGRQTLRFDFGGGLQGRLVKWKVSSSGAVKLFGGRYEAMRPGGEWKWYAIPIPETPEAWNESAIPIPATPEAWNESAIPIPETPEGWNESAIPIPETPEAWNESPLPIPESQAVAQWVEIPMDD